VVLLFSGTNGNFPFRTMILRRQEFVEIASLVRTACPLRDARISMQLQNFM
jgi:hypothetical protein